MQQRLTLSLLLTGLALTASAPSFGVSAAADPLVIRVGEDGYISAFDVSGPFASASTRSLFDPRIEGDSLSAVLQETEKRHPKTCQLGTTPGMLFKTRMYRSVVLSATLEVDSGGQYWLTAGTDGPVRVFLNGRSIHLFEGERKVYADTDLIPLALGPGENHLVIALKNREKRWWRAYFRLLTGDFSPADTVKISLSGEREATPPLLQTARLTFKRTVDIDTRSIEVRPRLIFPGGRPDEANLNCNVSFKAGGAPVPDLGESVAIDTTKAEPLDLSPYRFDQDPSPEQMTLSCGDAQFTRNLGFTMRHVRDLSAATTALNNILATRSDLVPSTQESLLWRTTDLRESIESGEEDLLYLTREIRNTSRMVDALKSGDDPYFDRHNQVQRRGYLSRLDGRLHPYVLYVPPLWRETGEDTFGLVVVLHGLGSQPMKAMQIVFGLPLKEGETGEIRARHPEPVSPAPYFVLAPDGFGPSGYRAFGEQDVMDVIDIVRKRYRINPNRVYITGPSMGGIGAASIPLHYPGRFAAAAPLCGYHSMFNYRQIKALRLTPWERFLLEYRSNASWAANGRHLPMYLVHGLKDSPGHSTVLVNEYQRRGYPVLFKTFDLGHNVWDVTYAGHAIFKHFQKYRRDPHPKRVTLTTARMRYRDAYWASIEDINRFNAWAKVDAEWKWDGRIVAKTQNIAALTFRNDDTLKARPVSAIVVDGVEIPVSGDAPEWQLTHTDAHGWKKREDLEAPPAKGTAERKKRPGLSGPIDDAFFEPLLFVYSDKDAAEERLTKQLAFRMRKPKGGVTVTWPVKKAADVTEEDIATHALVIIGTPKNNTLLARIQDALPIRVNGDHIVAGNQTYRGKAPAASFIYPNPLNPERYVVVHTAVSLEGLFYTDHLPEVVPDYIIYDGPTWRRKRERTLVDRQTLAVGFFDKSWQLDRVNQNP